MAPLFRYEIMYKYPSSGLYSISVIQPKFSPKIISALESSAFKTRSCSSGLSKTSLSLESFN